MYNEEVVTIDGVMHYMVDGVPADSGIFEKDGKLYFAEWTGILQTGKKYIDSTTANDLTTVGWHYFAEDGHMYDEEFAQVDGINYYFDDGMYLTGVFAVEDALYFADWTGALQVGENYVDTTYANDLVSTGYHYSDESGRLYDEEFVAVGENLYFMVDGEPLKAGVFEKDGNFYYADIYSGVVSVDTTTYITVEDTNKLVVFGWHEFDAEGKMIN